jgi:hypothetical protein
MGSIGNTIVGPMTKNQWMADATIMEQNQLHTNTMKTQITYTVANDPSLLISGDFGKNTRLNLALIDTLSGNVSVFLNQWPVK